MSCGGGVTPGAGPAGWGTHTREDASPQGSRQFEMLPSLVFATTQAAYEEAVHPLFETLDWLEKRLSSRRYLMGARVTEADWRLFPTLVRFDAAYYGHFKCNIRRIVDYPNLWGYLRELYQWGGVSGTVNFDHIKRHYHYSHESINPYRIVPVGPALDFHQPHGRDALRGAARETA